MEPLGPKIRRQRKRLGLTLDELASRSKISKPYLSLIETGRSPNPPSDEKLGRLEVALAFGAGELLTQAHLHRTPGDVRAVLQRLLVQSENRSPGDSATDKPFGEALDGLLQELTTDARNAGASRVTDAVPVIDCVSAGYPRDFRDTAYPSRMAVQYVSCPDVKEAGAFGARIQGDSMTPNYVEGDIVIFSPTPAPGDGDDCFVRLADGQTTFKRVFFEFGQGNKPLLRLQPRNERYRPTTVAKEKIHALYRAVYRYQRLDSGKTG